MVFVRMITAFAGWESHFSLALFSFDSSLGALEATLRSVRRAKSRETGSPSRLGGAVFARRIRVPSGRTRVMTETKRRRRRARPLEIGPAEADRDILDQYFAEVSRYPLLNADQEKALARKIQRGDQDALEELVKRNLRFVVS